MYSDEVYDQYKNGIKWYLKFLLHDIVPIFKQNFNVFFYIRWKPPRYFQQIPESKFERIRKKWHILVEGEDIPPPIKHFKVSIRLAGSYVTVDNLCTIS